MGQARCSVWALAWHSGVLSCFTADFNFKSWTRSKISLHKTRYYMLFTSYILHNVHVHTAQLHWRKDKKRQVTTGHFSDINLNNVGQKVLVTDFSFLKMDRCHFNVALCTHTTGAHVCATVHTHTYPYTTKDPPSTIRIRWHEVTYDSSFLA